MDISSLSKLGEIAGVYGMALGVTMLALLAAVNKAGVQVIELRRRAAAGDQKAQLARASSASAANPSTYV